MFRQFEFVPSKGNLSVSLRLVLERSLFQKCYFNKLTRPWDYIQLQDNENILKANTFKLGEYCGENVGKNFNRPNTNLICMHSLWSELTASYQNYRSFHFKCCKLLGEMKIKAFFVLLKTSFPVRFKKLKIQ